MIIFQGKYSLNVPASNAVGHRMLFIMEKNRTMFFYLSSL